MRKCTCNNQLGTANINVDTTGAQLYSAIFISGEVVCPVRVFFKI